MRKSKRASLKVCQNLIIRQTTVIPIILRHVSWNMTIFGDIQVLPADEQPIVGRSNQDEAFYEVTEELRKIVENRFANKALQRATQDILQGTDVPMRPPADKNSSLRRIAIPVGLGIIMLLAAIVWRYIPLKWDTSAMQATVTIQARATPTTLSEPIYPAKNTDETKPDGVYFRHNLQPEPGQPTPTYGFGVFRSDRVRVSCWARGDEVYGTRVWYYVYNITSPFGPGRPNKGWISAHYIDDGMPANQPASGVPQCTNPLPVGS